jgi:hypothetical protein
MEQDGAGGEGCHEAQKPVRPSTPKTPTKMMIDEHEASGHAVYRNWCAHCVMGKGRGNPHRVHHEAGDLPEIAFDYCYLGEGNEMPILEAKDRDTQSLYATTLLCKGRKDYARSFLCGVVRGLGHRKIIFRSDNEPSILALLLTVKEGCPETQIIFRSSPEGDSRANGMAQVAVREVKGQARVLMSEVRANYKHELSVKDPVMTWAVRHAANCINRGRIGEDGLMPERRRDERVGAGGGCS